MQRLSLFGCIANDVAKQSFVIIQRSQCIAGAAEFRHSPSIKRVHIEGYPSSRGAPWRFTIIQEPSTTGR